MSTMTCPNCRHILEYKDLGPAPAPGEMYKGVIQLGGLVPDRGPQKEAFDAVGEMVRDLARDTSIPSLTFRELQDHYKRTYVETGRAPGLPQTDLSWALQQHGCRKWRTAKARGYHLPDLKAKPDLEPDTVNFRHPWEKSKTEIDQSAEFDPFNPSASATLH